MQLQYYDSAKYQRNELMTMIISFRIQPTHLFLLCGLLVRSFPICVGSFSSSQVATWLAIMWDHFPFVWNHSPAATMRSRSMTSDSWPNGVATESDNCKFLNLLFANAPRKDLTKSQDASGIIKACFLTFVRGIHDVNDLKMIEVSFNLFPDQQKWGSSKWAHVSGCRPHTRCHRV